MAETTGLGHVGIYATDLMRQRDFYNRVIGLKIADEDLEGRGMVFMSSDPVSEHHEFVLMKGRVKNDDTNVIQQISFKVPTIGDMREYKHKLEEEPDVTIERIVSHGNAFGMYFLDPGGEPGGALLPDWLPGATAPRRPHRPGAVGRRASGRR